nr:ATP synthase subunit beta, chloroplastic [Tanacetum cinerariifolium]
MPRKPKGSSARFVHGGHVVLDLVETGEPAETVVRLPEVVEQKIPAYLELIGEELVVATLLTLVLHSKAERSYSFGRALSPVHLRCSIIYVLHWLCLLFPVFGFLTSYSHFRWDVSIYLSLDSKWEQSYFTKTCHGKEEGGNRHTWRAQYNGELSLVQVQDGPAAPGKRIEEASDSFMHASLGSGGYSSVGRASLLQLGRCDYGLDV